VSEKLNSNYVIVGAGNAGISAVEAIRETDPTGEIIVINGENATPYCRPLIVDVLRGEKSFDEIHLRDPGWYDERNIKVITGDPATGLDVGAKSIELKSGKVVSYEKLLIATGSQPFSPPIKGLDDIPAFTLYREDDIEELKAACKPGDKALLAGIGLIGLQAMTSLKELGVEITSVELMPKVLPLILDQKASEYAKARLEEHGIEVITGSGIAEFKKTDVGDHKLVAVTDKCQEIGFDFLLMATGMRPDLALLEGSGIEIDRGIKVSGEMQTNVPGIYAAGDITVFENWIEGEPEIHAHWVNAYHQGRIAGTHMAGGTTEPYQPMFLNSLSIFGLPIITFGASRIDEPADADVYTEENPDRPSYRRFVVKDGKIIAATLINDVHNAGIFQYLAREKVNLTGAAASIFAQDTAGKEFLYRHHEKLVSGEGVDWPESMSLMKWFKKDHAHTRWGKKDAPEK